MAYSVCNGDFSYRRVSPHPGLPLLTSARFFLYGRRISCGVAASIMDSVFFQTLLSRALQDDGWLATVSDAPLPLHFIGGASVAHDTEQPSPQLTPARRSSKWDAAERHQSSRRPPHEPGCQDPGRSS
ncbi:hypothetical protein EVAR_44994_1 [Eumeta japonica]|uniref:Uncharacterized protein n=1 Tax=Eumeta variegata TaxID=151549 RepID=A0A4C1XET0_EUMVA|nr:hypothetical protein EVAR_44994_1 [Eumeta japonica]